MRSPKTKSALCGSALALGLGILIGLGGSRAGGAHPPAPAEEVRRLIDAGRYREAEAAARALAADVEARSGPESLETARALDLLVEALDMAGKWFTPAGREAGERAVRIKEKMLGRDDPDVARSLLVLADLRGETEPPGALLPLYRRILSIRERALGPDHPDVATALEGLASDLAFDGKFEEAIPLAERALAIESRSFGPERLEVATGLYWLGRIKALSGRPRAALPLFQRCLAIRRKALGPEHPLVAKVLYRIAMDVLQEEEDYAGSRDMLQQVLTLQEKSLGKDHPSVEYTVARLAISVWHLGDYVGARPLLERALADAERISGPDSMDASDQLADLGLYHYFLGDYEASRPLQEKALAIRERNYGPDNPVVARSLNNLALMLTDMGDFAAARPLAERALAIWEKSGNHDDTDFPRIINTLATLLRDSGDFEGARKLYERDIDLWQKIGGSDPPGVALDLTDYAEMLLEHGDLEGARARFARALAIREKRLGPEHPDVARTLSGLARVQLLGGQRSQALEGALRSEAIARKQFRETARSLAEREALGYERIRTSGLDVALSALVATPAAQRPAGLIERIWDELVRSRGMVLDEMALRHRSAASSERRRAAGPARDLEQARNRLARLVVEGAEGADPRDYATRLVRAREEKESAERALAAVSAGFRRELAEVRVGLKDVHAALPLRTALVAYVLYTELAPGGTAAKGGGRRPGEVPSYLALVLRADGRDPVVVPLGPASTIEALVRDWREEVARPPKGVAVGGGGGEERYRTVAASLKQMVWDPVARQLAGAATVFVVPDGVLNLVNLATLPSADGHYLVEDGPLIHYLSSERAAVRPAAVRKAGQGLLAVGGVDFDARLAEAATPAEGAGDPGASIGRALPAAAGVSGPEVRVAQAVRQASCADFRSLRFEPLPDSRAEVEEIGSLWKQWPAGGAGGREAVVTLTGPRADKEAFKRNVVGRRVVHLATHGFFAQDRCPSALERARGQALAVPATRSGTGPGDDPLLLSGLALAGANRRQEAGGAEDDGLLTAEEIASLDLSGVQWAVLSACETGVGTVQVGEGVLGLRRAFEIAGADTLILSLWSVEDASAREWMRALYGARLSGRSTAEAVRRASREMIDARRRAGRSTHPASWGAFVATGDWR